MDAPHRSSLFRPESFPSAFSMKETAPGKARHGIYWYILKLGRASALTCLKTTVRFIDYIGAAFTANHPAITMPRFQGLERISDFHNVYPSPPQGQA